MNKQNKLKPEGDPLHALNFRMAEIKVSGITFGENVKQLQY